MNIICNMISLLKRLRTLIKIADAYDKKEVGYKAAIVNRDGTGNIIQLPILYTEFELPEIIAKSIGEDDFPSTPRMP